MNNRKKLLIGAVAVFAAAFVLVGVYQALRFVELESSQKEVLEQIDEQLTESDRYGQAQLFYDGSWYKQKENLETILVMGLDQYEENLEEEDNRNNRRADFLLLLILDHDRKLCDVLEINRDTMADITILGLANQSLGTFRGQLTLAHTFGSGKVDSCLNTVNAVSNYLYDAKIDHYISMTLDAVPVVNDAVGGVTVTIEDDFSNMDPSLKQGETLTLQGSQALNYVRGRREIGDSSNVSRMKRQEQYLLAFYEKARIKAENDAQFLWKLLLDVSEFLVSDYSVEKLSGNASQLFDYQLNGFHHIVGEAVKGEEFMEFYADDEALKAQLVDLLYEKVK